jgi:hypothetical protein
MARPNPPRRTTMAMAIAAVAVLAAWWLPSGPAGPATAAAEPPSCAVGTWTATDLMPVVVGASGTQEITILGVTGTARLKVAPDGEWETLFEDIKFTATFMSLPVTGTIGGGMRGSFTDVGDGKVLDRVSGGTISITVSLFGQRVAQERDIRPRDAVESTLECDGDRMTVSTTTGDNTLTLVWARAE